jgi:hypothetical protein
MNLRRQEGREEKVKKTLKKRTYLRTNLRRQERRERRVKKAPYRKRMEQKSH